MPTFDRAKSTQEIRRILFTYPDCIDRGDIEGVVKLLTGVKMRGVRAASSGDAGVAPLSADDVRAMYAGIRLYGDGLPHTKHLITNIEISYNEDGTKADVQSDFVVLQALDDFPLQPIITGRYEEIYEHDGTAWRLTLRRDIPDLLGDLSRHVTPELLSHIPEH